MSTKIINFAKIVLEYKKPKIKKTTISTHFSHLILDWHITNNVLHVIRNYDCWNDLSTSKKMYLYLINKFGKKKLTYLLYLDKIIYKNDILYDKFPIKIKNSLSRNHRFPSYITCENLTVGDELFMGNFLNENVPNKITEYIVDDNTRVLHYIFDFC